MRIIAPYTAMHPATHAWLLKHAPNAERVDLNHNPNAYWQLLADLWASGQDFTLIEHDMQPPANAIQRFNDCPNEWCVNPYPGPPIPGTPRNRTFRCALGSTRFRAQLTQRHPTTITHLANGNTFIFGRHANTQWDRLDSQIASLLFQHGERPCEHEPATHHHQYPESTRTTN